MKPVTSEEISGLIDNELSAERAAEVRAAIEADPSLRNEYETLAGLGRCSTLEISVHGVTHLDHPEMIDEQAEYNFLYAEYQYWEIGRSEEWFKEQCRELLNDQVKIKREILLVWPMSTDGSVFTEEQLDHLSKYKKEIVATLPVRPRKGHCPPNLEIVFTEMPDPSIPYLLSIDTSGGVGQDYTAFVLSHPDDMRQIGVMKTNTADDEALRIISEHLMVDLFPKSIAIIERNYLGSKPIPASVPYPLPAML